MTIVILQTFISCKSVVKNWRDTNLFVFFRQVNFKGNIRQTAFFIFCLKLVIKSYNKLICIFFFNYKNLIYMILEISRPLIKRKIDLLILKLICKINYEPKFCLLLFTRRLQDNFGIKEDINTK